MKKLFLILFLCMSSFGFAQNIQKNCIEITYTCLVGRSVSVYILNNDIALQGICVGFSEKSIILENSDRFVVIPLHQIKIIYFDKGGNNETR